MSPPPPKLIAPIFNVTVTGIYVNIKSTKGDS